MSDTQETTAAQEATDTQQSVTEAERADLQAVATDPETDVPDPPADDEAPADQPPDAEAREGDYSEFELRAMKGFGYEPDDLSDLPPEAAERLISRLVDAQRRIDRQFGTLGQALRDARPGASDDKAEVEPADGADPIDALEFSSDDWGDDAAQSLTNLADEVRRLRMQVTDNTDSLSAGTAERQRRQLDHLQREADTWLAAQDPDLYPELGAMPMAEVAEGAPEHEARARLLDEARVYLAGYRQVHGQTPPLSDALQRAAVSIWPDAAARADRRKLSEQVRARTARLTPRPTQRRGPAATQGHEHTERVLRDKGLL